MIKFLFQTKRTKNASNSNVNKKPYCFAISWYSGNFSCKYVAISLMVGLVAEQRNLPFIDGFSMQKICARQMSSMCMRGIEPRSSCKSFNEFRKSKLPVIGDTIVSILPGTYGRRVSPPTRPQTSVTTSSLPSSTSLYFSTSFSANVFDLMYPYNTYPEKKIDIHCSKIFIYRPNTRYILGNDHGRNKF